MTRLELWAQYGWDRDGRHPEWPWWTLGPNLIGNPWATRRDGRRLCLDPGNEAAARGPVGSYWSAKESETAVFKLGQAGRTLAQWRAGFDAPTGDGSNSGILWAELARIDREEPLPPPLLALGQGWLLEDGTQVQIIGVSPDGELAAAVELWTHPAPHDGIAIVRSWSVATWHRSALQQLPCITGPGAPWAPPEAIQ